MIQVNDVVLVGSRHAARQYYKGAVGHLARVLKVECDFCRVLLLEKEHWDEWCIHIDDALLQCFTNQQAARLLRR